MSSITTILKSQFGFPWFMFLCEIFGVYLRLFYFWDSSLNLNVSSYETYQRKILIKIYIFIAGAKRFLNWHVFNPLGRLTYSIYICHLSISRVIFGRENNLASFSYPVFVSSEIFSIMLKVLV